METVNSEEDDYLLERDIIIRNYQMNLIEVAKKQNSIVFLPTGTGKTLIAIHVLCSKTSEIIGNFPEKGKRVFFLAPTKTLVYQLHKSISIHTKFKVGVFVGDMLVDFWSRKDWEENFKNYQVMVMTAEILKHIIELKFIAPSQISLIVFDECHHAALQHPYRLILQILAQEDLHRAPLLLGLSAVLLNANPKKKDVVKIICDMKNSFKGVILTAQQLNEAARFAAKPKEILVPYKSSAPLGEKFLPLYDEVINQLNDLKLIPVDKQSIPKHVKLYANPNRARRLKNWFVKAKDNLKECGIYCGALLILYYIILVEKFRLMTTDPEEIQILVYCRTAFYKLRHILLGVMGEETVKNIYKYSSNKIQTLLNLLMSINENAKKKHMAVLIFVYQKSTAIILATLLKKLKDIDSNFSFLKPEFIIGSNIYDKDTLLHEFKNEEIIKEFSSQNLNTLVSTNVLEEGVDITSCNVVISFDFPVSYSSYFQSRGRARDKDGIYYVFVKEEELTKKNTLLNEFGEIEEELYKIISKEGRQVVDEEDLNLDKDEDEISSMAIKTIYRYCGKLPQDKYSSLLPTAWYTEVSGGKKASIQLPINCPIQDVIEGEVMANAKLARKSVFMETLKRLKQMGEIDENGNPVTYLVKANCFDYLFPHFKKEEIEKDSPLPGTKKRRQTYKVKSAQMLSECLPQPGEKAYLHVIDFAMKFEKLEREDKLMVQKVLQSPVTFAMLSSKKLCKICQFPLFVDMGRIDCNVLINHDEFVLSKSELEDIKLCHFAIFQKVLKIIKNFQIFDNRNKGNSFYIVPVKKDEGGRFVLDWEVIRNDFCKDNKSAIVRYNPCHSRNFKKDIQNSERMKILQTSNPVAPLNVINKQDFRRADSYEELNQKPQFEMSEADYKYFIISPNYRNISPPQTYIVSELRTDLSPLSPFPSSLYPDYCAYYQDKYMIEISNVKQPLLRVANIFTCSNFNKPKTGKNQERWSLKANEELLVPELCDIIPFDRRYWLKALLLPTAINRLCHLYCVEEFRRKIINETGLGLVELPATVEWKPLEVDPYLEKNENIVTTNSESLNMALPLSQFKLNSKTDLNITYLKRNVLEIGVCDLEYFNSFFSNVESEEEVIESLLLPPKVNHEANKFKNTKRISIPKLKPLQKEKSKLGPELAHLVQALTAVGANDIVNYERLETLGDAFLKFAVANFLFKNLDDNEGVLTFLKGKLVGNRNLLYCGLAKGFQNVLNVTDFAPMSDWNPPLVCLPEKLVNEIMSNNIEPAVFYRWDIPSNEQFSGSLSDETLSKNEETIRKYDKTYGPPTNCLLSYTSLSDKTISDSVEAVIGMYLWEFGLFGGFEILKWLDILPKSSGSCSELMENMKIPNSRGSNLTSVINILSEVLYLDLEETLGYQFKNKALLLEAITHPTYSRNRATYCYQRLEFLGDAVLDFLITCYIYQYCGDLTPGQVTDIRSALVNNVTFASLSVRYEFHKYLLKLSSRLNNAIEEFVIHQAARNHVVDDNAVLFSDREAGDCNPHQKVLILLEEKDCLIAEAVQVPKALGDVFESLAGAIYLDSGNSLETVWAVYYRLMKNEIDTFSKIIPKSPVRLLHEICECTPPYFEVAQLDGITRVACTAWYDNVEIKVYGFGANSKEAKRSAAKFAVKKISELKK